MNNELVVEPNKLEFNGPFTRKVIVQIHLHNPTAQVIAFKVKTIEPIYYLVKPSKGVIAPEQNATVTVLMRPLESDSQVAHFIASKQKFLVQWVTSDDSGDKSVAELFGSNAKVHQVKLDCVFNAQPSQSEEMADSYKSVEQLPAGSSEIQVPEVRDPSNGLESGTTIPEAAAPVVSPSSQWRSPRLVASLVSTSLALLLAIFLAYYYNLVHINSGPNN